MAGQFGTYRQAGLEIKSCRREAAAFLQYGGPHQQYVGPHQQYGGPHLRKPRVARFFSRLPVRAERFDMEGIWSIAFMNS